MTPAEQLLHDIAATFCAPRVVRVQCPWCGGAGVANYLGMSPVPSDQLRDCVTCSGRGYIVTEQEPKP